MYCTKADLLLRFDEDEVMRVTDDDAVLQRAIDAACAEIDGYLASRYTLPFVEPSADLTNKACDMVRFHLYQSRGLLESETSQIERNYLRIIRYFEQVAKGAITLLINASDSAIVNTCTPLIGSDARHDWSGF